MADPIYEIPEKPVYDPAIRALQDSDPARATTIFNPVLGQMIVNTHAVKLESEANAKRIEEVSKQAGEAADPANITLPGGKTLTEAISDIETSKAGLNSPALTGTPTAPTAAAGANSTQIATTAFVKQQGYASAASPALTGTPTAPTPTKTANNTQIATTAFVKAQGYATTAELQAAVAEAAKSAKAYSHTVTASGWKQGAAASDGSYWQEFSVANSEITVGDVVLVIPGDATAEAFFKASVRGFVDTYAGGFKLSASATPTANFTIYYTISKQEV